MGNGGELIKELWHDGIMASTLTSNDWTSQSFVAYSALHQSDNKTYIRGTRNMPGAASFRQSLVNCFPVLNRTVFSVILSLHQKRASKTAGRRAPTEVIMSSNFP